MSTSDSYGHMACPTCRSVYARSIRLALASEAGQFQCSVCGEILAQWQTQYVPVYALVEASLQRGTLEPGTRPPLRNVKLASIIAETLDR